MYNSISPPTLIAVYKEMVRETKESAFSSAPGIGAVPFLSCLWLSCSSSSHPLPAHTHVLQNTFSSVVFFFSPWLLSFCFCSFLISYFFIGPIWGVWGEFQSYFRSPDFYSLGSCYSVWHVLQNLNQSQNTVVNLQVGISGIFIHLETADGIQLGLGFWDFFFWWGFLGFVGFSLLVCLFFGVVLFGFFCPVLLQHLRQMCL